MAIVEGSPAEFPSEWDKYTERDTAVNLKELRRDGPDAPEAGPLQQLFIVDVKSETARPLWNVPSTSEGESVLWSPDGRSVILAPAFLPTESADCRRIGLGKWS